MRTAVKKSVAMMVVVVLAIGMMTACGKKSVVGTWCIDTLGGKSVADKAKESSVTEGQLQTNYTFNEDGTGKMESYILTASKQDGAFKWKEADDKITITVNGSDVVFTWDGDKLKTGSGDTETFLKSGKGTVEKPELALDGSTDAAQ